MSTDQYPCILPGCKIVAGHKTGLCKIHRKRRCVRCGVTFTFHYKTMFCTKHRPSRKKKNQTEYDEAIG